MNQLIDKMIEGYLERGHGKSEEEILAIFEKDLSFAKDVTEGQRLILSGDRVKGRQLLTDAFDRVLQEAGITDPLERLNVMEKALLATMDV